ncbi:MAG: hypothetical protein ABSG68_21875, partial [Thermoguttaceae bacterium]
EAKPAAKEAPEAKEAKPAAKEAPEAKEAKPAAKPAAPAPKEINVVLVADVDAISQGIFRIREMGDMPEEGVHFDFDNVTFVLNVLDELAKDGRFVEIRSRRPTHRTLLRIDEVTDDKRRKTTEAHEEFNKKYQTAVDEEEKGVRKDIDELKKRESGSTQDVMIDLAMTTRDRERRLETKREQLKQERDRDIKKTDTELNLYVQKVQRNYKLWAVLLPPIPPLVLAAVVFAGRRRREREGVSRKRMR